MSIATPRKSAPVRYQIWINLVAMTLSRQCNIFRIDMPRFQFTAVVDGEVAKAGNGLDFASLESARSGALTELGKIAAARLGCGRCELISVEIFDEAKTPITELRLEFREIPK